MTQRMDDVIRLCCEIADQSEFKNTWKNIRKGILIGATGAGFGGLLLGPVLFFVAGAACSLFVWWTSGQFKSVPQIPMKLPHAEKQKLHNDIVAVLGNLTCADTAQLVDIVLSNPALREKFAGVVLNSIKKRV